MTAKTATAPRRQALLVWVQVRGRDGGWNTVGHLGGFPRAQDIPWSSVDRMVETMRRRTGQPARWQLNIGV